MDSTFYKKLLIVEKKNYQQKNNKHIQYPNDIKDIPNLILYGPPNSGKYFYALSILQNFSKSNLKYQKKMEILINKEPLYFNMSDIHYEIDFDLLGTSSKNIWILFFNNVIDSVLAKEDKTAFIICKNFHNIHPDLLEIFYSFIDSFKSNVYIKFIIITQQLFFIPDTIKKKCEVVKCKFNNKIEDKTFLYKFHINTCNYFIDFLIDFKNKYNSDNTFDNEYFFNMRQIIYDILIKNINIYTVIFYIFSHFYKNNMFKNNELQFNNTYLFLKYYNNNYRPIYHIEKYFYELINNLN